jgi:MFS family permease
MMTIRFFLGLAEASTYSGAVYIMGSWYKPTEIAKRVAIFTACGQIGTMFAGIMMTAIHTGMEGMGGLEGWQWVFIIGAFSFPCLATLPATASLLLHVWPRTNELLVFLRWYYYLARCHFWFLLVP